MLIETNCRRCGKRITTMDAPIHSSVETMQEWGRICTGCMTEEEQFKMMLAMNHDISRRIQK